MMRMPPRAVFFDLDGTLVDSAPDLIAAMQALCIELGAPAPDADAVRKVVSAGGRAMLRAGLAGADDAIIDRWLPRFLDLYSVSMNVHTRLYDGMADVLSAIESRGIPWGIVTNKPGWLARPMVEQMEVLRGSSVLVTGDCLPVRKPHPAPVLFACEKIGVFPAVAVMIGDDVRDVQAGRAAGTYSIAAGWGYLDGGEPHLWLADAVAKTPSDLLAVFGIH